jgi:hypothetical protein
MLEEQELLDWVADAMVEASTSLVCLGGTRDLTIEATPSDAVSKFITLVDGTKFLLTLVKIEEA